VKGQPSHTVVASVDGSKVSSTEEQREVDDDTRRGGVASEPTHSQSVEEKEDRNAVEKTRTDVRQVSHFQGSFRSHRMQCVVLRLAATLCINLVRFNAVSLEFTTLQWVQQASVITRG